MSTQPLRLGKDAVLYRVAVAQPHVGLLAGVPALVLQTLHPAIGGAVYDHSTLKQSPINRLQRTADYVFATAFGDDEEARALIERVHKRHAPVRGTNSVTGEAFTADDSDLQVYVHVTEMWAFLEAYRFLGGKLTPDEQDRYWAELQPIGAMLGATVEHVPATAAEAQAVLDAMRPHLHPTPQGLDTIEFLLAPTGHPVLTALKPLMPVNRRATAAMLPRSIRALAGLPTSAAGDRAIRVLARVANTLAGPLLKRLAWRLGGKDTRRMMLAAPEHTTRRNFTLPLPSPERKAVSRR